MAVVVEDLLERAFVDHGLIAFETKSFFAFERLDGDGAKLDPLHSAPGFVVTLENANAVKACLLECLEKQILTERAADAAAPEFGIVLQLGRHIFVADDVADDGATAAFEDTMNFAEELLLVRVLNEVEHTVGDDHVHRAFGDHGSRLPKPVGM